MLPTGIIIPYDPNKTAPQFIKGTFESKEILFDIEAYKERVTQEFISATMRENQKATIENYEIDAIFQYETAPFEQLQGEAKQALPKYFARSVGHALIKFFQIPKQSRAAITGICLPAQIQQYKAFFTRIEVACQNDKMPLKLMQPNEIIKRNSPNPTQVAAPLTPWWQKKFVLTMFACIVIAVIGLIFSLVAATIVSLLGLACLSVWMFKNKPKQPITTSPYAAEELPSNYQLFSSSQSNCLELRSSWRLIKIRAKRETLTVAALRTPQWPHRWRD